MMARGRQTGVVRGVFVLLGLAALAVALSLLVGNNRSTLTLFWPPHRVDVSFNLVLFVLVFGFGLLYMALRAVAALRELPVQARRWRSQQLERAVVASVLDALSHQLAGRFVRAQACAQQALNQMSSSPSSSPWPRKDQMELLAHLLLAESAQSLQNRPLRDKHLELALQPRWARQMPEAGEGALLRAVRWAIEDRDPAQARARLAALPQGAGRRIQALRLKLRVARMDGAGAEALETARLLAKHKAFSPEASRSLIRGLALGAIQQAHDLSQLREVWADFDVTERQTPELALAAARRALGFAEQTQTEPVSWADSVPAEALDECRPWVRHCLEPLWDRYESLDEDTQAQLVRVLEPALIGIDAPWLARLEQRQRQLPDNPCLQYLTGQACVQRQLWGKAAQLLGQASARLKDRVLLRRSWCAMARLAQERGDESAAREAWMKAALIE